MPQDPSATQIRVVLVDDHEVVREGLRLMLEKHIDLTVLADVGTANEAWAVISSVPTDVLVADVELADSSGIELAKRVQVERSSVRAVMLSGHSGKAFVAAAIAAGVAGYVLKVNAGTELLNAIRAVFSGQAYFSPEVSAVVAREYRQQLEGHATSSLLSDREREVLKRIADGQSTKEIAYALRVSTKTIDSHRLKLMAKLELKSIAELTKYAVREWITKL